MSDTQMKVSAEHLRRDAYLYVRQSSPHQVVHNTESARRQYDLRGRAVALGWPAERVIVIDVDQGQSGSSAADREGFQRLVADVSMGKAGIVLGLECSRLARNNADWHRLLELCALSRTLICDEDGLYDPGAINDRLLARPQRRDQRGRVALHSRPFAGRDPRQGGVRRARRPPPRRPGL
jgi:DNA invertase Pin-like site-specific DNA recombinase